MRKARKITLISSCVVAVVAIAVGLCCFFFSAKPVREVPNTLEVVVIEGDFHLVAEYCNGYEYEFRLEQKFEEEYVLIDTVSSKVNNINLAQQPIQLGNGNEFRFSVRYTYESEKGQWSKFLEWGI